MDWTLGLQLPLLSLPQLLQRLVAALTVVGVHGFVAVALAERLGDPGPRRDGRRTPSPLAHLDVVGLVHALFFRVVWMPRIDVAPKSLRGRWRGALAVTLGASASLAVVSAVMLLARPFVLSVLPDTAGITVTALLSVTADMAIVAAAFHLLPLPPFVGAAWMPWPVLAAVFGHPRARWVGIAALALLSLAGVTSAWVSAITSGWRGLLGY